jgi:hypothetical protein
MSYTAEQIMAIGGSAWASADGRKHRVYLNLTDNDWLDMVGLDVSRYKSGNIQMAWLNGERISNTRAGKLMAGKIYWDAADGEIHLDGVHETMKTDLLNVINARIANL